MPLNVYTPNVDEVIAELARHLSNNPLMMLVAVTDTDDPAWRGGDHINFVLNATPKGWFLEGSNGMKIKISGKEVVAKAKKTEKTEADEAPPITEAPRSEPAQPTPEITEQTPPTNP
jgi:hypothetical protein